MKAVKAFGKNFFRRQAYPINVIRISGETGMPQHEGDLTDVKHYHDFAELVIVTKGYGTHWIDGTEYPVAAGDVFVLQGKTEHFFRGRHGLELYNLMHDSHRLRQYLRNLRENSGYNAMFLLEPNYRKRHKFRSRLHLSRRSLAHVEATMKRMLDEQEQRAPGYDTMLLSSLLELTIFFSREYSKTEIPQAQALCRIGDIIGKLETSYRKAWSIAELSKLAGMSRSGLTGTFREATGHSPIDYLLRIRLQKAAELLIESDLPVSAIAFECGFNDSNYLTRQFRRIYRVSPRRFRANHA